MFPDLNAVVVPLVHAMSLSLDDILASELKGDGLHVLAANLGVMLEVIQRQVSSKVLYDLDHSFGNTAFVESLLALGRQRSKGPGKGSVLHKVA